LKIAICNLSRLLTTDPDIAHRDFASLPVSGLLKNNPPRIILLPIRQDYIVHTGSFGLHVQGYLSTAHFYRQFLDQLPLDVENGQG
jgi:hypothetical protein